MSIGWRRGVEPQRHDDEWAAIRLIVRRYALSRTRQPDLADDIAQQAVLNAIEYQQNHIVISLHALAFRIADNLIKGHYRRLKPISDISEIDGMACARPLPDRITEDRAETRAMLEALNKMPPLRRDVFMRRRLDGQSCEDIGRALNLNPKAIEKHITRALVDLHAARRKWREVETPDKTIKPDNDIEEGWAS
ncbi:MULTISPECIES: RNA polymerase sigma factor [Asticcacaulis]|uniref:RNA polymerase sigma factor n=1 Tax=Asticcacaulis TaxID=76890 RepID=UPI001676D159|nr:MULTISPECIES: sigma-70 family RNA polymerase sigma factor [Asticcacaulis]WKL57610.1 sigma-70 family RNA polymerase sigma factor [Asticcacaulis sp. ZE23SCel15]